jgi:hypothetical protein
MCTVAATMCSVRLTCRICQGPFLCAAPEGASSCRYSTPPSAMNWLLQALKNSS